MSLHCLGWHSCMSLTTPRAHAAKWVHYVLLDSACFLWTPLICWEHMSFGCDWATGLGLVTVTQWSWKYYNHTKPSQPAPLFGQSPKHPPPAAPGPPSSRAQASMWIFTLSFPGQREKLPEVLSWLSHLKTPFLFLFLPARPSPAPQDPRLSLLDFRPCLQPPHPLLPTWPYPVLPGSSVLAHLPQCSTLAHFTSLPDPVSQRVEKEKAIHTLIFIFSPVKASSFLPCFNFSNICYVASVGEATLPKTHFPSLRSRKFCSVSVSGFDSLDELPQGRKKRGNWLLVYVKLAFIPLSRSWHFILLQCTHLGEAPGRAFYCKVLLCLCNNSHQETLCMLAIAGAPLDFPLQDFALTSRWGFISLSIL